MHALNVKPSRYVAEEGGSYSALPGFHGRGSLNYDGLVRSIVALHQESVGRAAVAVNRWLTLRNWLIGANLVEFEQDGKDRAGYGARLLEEVASDLKRWGSAGSASVC